MHPATSVTVVILSILVVGSLRAADPSPGVSGEPTLHYTSTFLGSTNQDDVDGTPYQIVPGWITDVAVAPDGTVFMGGGSEANGVAAFRYDAATKKVRVVGRYGRGDVGSPQSKAVVVDKDHFFSANSPGSGGLKRYVPLAPGSPVVGPAVSAENSGFSPKELSPWTPGKKNWSVRWEGSLVPDRDGPHQLALRFGPGVRMWVDGKQVIDDWKDAYQRSRNAPELVLKRGQAIAIVIEYFLSDGGICLLHWRRPGEETTPVPPGALRTPDGKPGLRGSYFSDRELTTPAFVRDDTIINFAHWSGATLSGLDLHDGELYAADETFARIRAFNATTRKETRAWDLDFVPGKIVIDRNPAGPYLWVADQSNGAVHCFTLQGVSMPAATINGIAVPGGLAIDQSGNLLVGDCGPDNWVLRYDIREVQRAPKRLGSFGAKGGVWSGTRPGLMGPQRFCRPVGLDVDAQGRIYVACNFGITGTANTSIECYEPNGTRLWWVYAFPYCDGAVVDPLDETLVYTSRARFRADWSKPVGQEFTWEAISYEQTTRGEYADARHTSFLMPAAARLMHGRTFVFMATQMMREPSWLYRLAGDSLVPTGYQSSCCGGSFKDAPGGASLPPKNPIGRNDQTRSTNWGALRWTDLDGNGSWKDRWDIAQPDCEFSHVELGFVNATGCVDATGAFWSLRQAGVTSRLLRTRCTGLNKLGVPLYAEAHENFTAKLPLFASIRAIEYDTAKDAMYFMAEETKGEMRLFRYDSFTTVPKLAWKSPALPIDDKSFTPKVSYGAGMPKYHKTVGDYVFVPYGYGGWVRVYAAVDGSFRGTMRPTGISGNQAGELDSNHGLTVQRLKSGEYILFVESAGLHRVTAYRWKP